MKSFFKILFFILFFISIALNLISFNRITELNDNVDKTQFAANTSDVKNNFLLAQNAQYQKIVSDLFIYTIERDKKFDELKKENDTLIYQIEQLYNKDVKYF